MRDTNTYMQAGGIVCFVAHNRAYIAYIAWAKGFFMGGQETAWNPFAANSGDRQLITTQVTDPDDSTDVTGLGA